MWAGLLLFPLKKSNRSHSLLLKQSSFGHLIKSASCSCEYKLLHSALLRVCVPQENGPVWYVCGVARVPWSSRHLRVKAACLFQPWFPHWYMAFSLRRSLRTRQLCSSLNFSDLYALGFPSAIAAIAATDKKQHIWHQDPKDGAQVNICFLADFNMARPHSKPGFPSLLCQLFCFVTERRRERGRQGAKAEGGREGGRKVQWTFLCWILVLVCFSFVCFSFSMLNYKMTTKTITS